MKIEICPNCGQGTLVSEIIEDYPNGEHIESYFYSCGHKHEIINLPQVKTIVTVELEIESTDGRKGKEITKKPKHGIVETYKKNENTIHLRHLVKNEFQVIKYRFGEVKHIDCKNCNNSWRYNSGVPKENHFFI